MKEIKITTTTIKLDQFLKWANIVSTGGEAKSLIQAGKITVNGEIEYRRAHKLKPGDIISNIDNSKKYKVIKK